MKEKIIATDKVHLKYIIEEEIQQHGNDCDLNHIYISNLKSLSHLFVDSKFNGDISKWNVSKITNMNWLFANSQFNGDISNWNVSKVTNMNLLFYHSKFNADLSSWRPLKIQITTNMFYKCSAPAPYWFGNNNEEIVKNIESYDLFNKINSEMESKEIKIKKVKL